MLDVKSEMKDQLDAIDALDHTASMLRGLGFICIALCESPSVIDEDTCGLIADIAYHCANIETKASEIIYAEFRKNAVKKNGFARTDSNSEKIDDDGLGLAA